MQKYRVVLIKTSRCNGSMRAQNISFHKKRAQNMFPLPICLQLGPSPSLAGWQQAPAIEHYYSSSSSNERTAQRHATSTVTGTTILSRALTRGLYRVGVKLRAVLWYRNGSGGAWDSLRGACGQNEGLISSPSLPENLIKYYCRQLMVARPPRVSVGPSFDQLLSTSYV
jgi:hypothetical protein